MKIAHIITNLNNGGAEKLAIELANEQSKAANIVYLILFDELNDTMLLRQFVDDSVKIKLFKRRKTFSIIVSLRLLFFLFKEEINVVHTHKPSSVAHILLSLFFFSKINFIHTVHNELSYYKSFFRKLSKYPFYVKKVKNICLTPNIATDYKREFPAMFFDYITNGVAPLIYEESNDLVSQFFDKINAQFVLLFVGRNSEQKNLSMLFHILDLYDEATLAIVCVGLEREDILKNYNVANKIDKSLFICGKQSNVGDYMFYSDALILTSKNEGMPLVIIEAFSMGLPVLSTSVGGVPEMIVDGENGFLAKEVEINSIKSCIDNFIELNDEGVAKISHNNREKYSKLYSIIQCANNYLAQYENK